MLKTILNAIGERKRDKRFRKSRQNETTKLVYDIQMVIEQWEVEHRQTKQIYLDSAYKQLFPHIFGFICTEISMHNYRQGNGRETNAAHLKMITSMNEALESELDNAKKLNFIKDILAVYE